MNYILAVSGGQDKSWAQHSYCSRCSRYLDGWLSGTHQSMPFAAPMVWMEQKDHLSNCYFCWTKIDGHNSKSKHTVANPIVHSAIRPVEHDDSLPIPKSPQKHTLYEEPTSTSPLMNQDFMFQYGSWFPRTFIHSFTLFSVYPYTGKVPRMWKLSK